MKYPQSLVEQSIRKENSVLLIYRTAGFRPHSFGQSGKSFKPMVVTCLSVRFVVGIVRVCLVGVSELLGMQVGSRLHYRF